MAVEYFINRANGSTHLTSSEWSRFHNPSRIKEEKVCGVFEEMAARMRAYHPVEYAKVDGIMTKKYGRTIHGSEGTM